MTRFWDVETAAAALRFEANRLGRTPRDKDLRSPARTCASLKTYRRLFGSLGAAQLAAGLPLNHIGGRKGWRKRYCKRGHARIPEHLDTQGHCRLCAAHWRSRRGRGAMLPRDPNVILSIQARRTEEKRAWWARQERAS